LTPRRFSFANVSLERVAVLGDEFRVRTLALMCSKPEDRVKDLLDEAVRSGVLTEAQEIFDSWNLSEA